MRYLEKRYQNFLKCKNTFGKAQCRTFLDLLKNRYGNVLEVGCGRGFFSYLMLRKKGIKFDHLYGVDVFNNCQKEELRRLTKHFSFKKINKDNNLPFSDNRFDFVFSMDVIEHVLSDRKFISEQIRVLKPGGEIIIGTPNRYRMANLLPLVFGKLKYPRKIGSDYYGDVVHVREYGKEAILDLLGLFGDEIDKGEIIPCWLGLDFFNIGWVNPPNFLGDFCQFWFIRFSKKRQCKNKDMVL